MQFAPVNRWTCTWFQYSECEPSNAWPVTPGTTSASTATQPPPLHPICLCPMLPCLPPSAQGGRWGLSSASGPSSPLLGAPVSSSDMPCPCSVSCWCQQAALLAGPALLCPDCWCPSCCLWLLTQGTRTCCLHVILTQALNLPGISICLGPAVSQTLVDAAACLPVPAATLLLQPTAPLPPPCASTPAGP